MPNAVLDASAILAVLAEESGAPAIKPLLIEGTLSAVNLSEVIAKLTDWGYEPQDAARLVERLGLRVIAFDKTLAQRAGQLRPQTKAFGLSLGDRACLALAEQEGMPACTTDRGWADLDIGIQVQVAR